MKIKSILLAVCCLLLATSGAEAKSYRGALHKATRTNNWYSLDSMSANMVWHATYFSPDFRRAYTEQHAKKKYLNAIEAARFTAEQEKQQAEGTEFFMGIYTKKPYRQFDLGKGSFWELLLVTDKGELIQPTRIEEVPVSPYEQIMFPYLDRWSTAYRVVFPKIEPNGSFKLTLRSVIGKASLKWKN